MERAHLLSRPRRAATSAEASVAPTAALTVHTEAVRSMLPKDPFPDSLPDTKHPL
jgi:hypothetical protein